MYNYALYYFKEAFALKCVALSNLFDRNAGFSILDLMILVIRMLSVKSTNEHRSCTKRKNATGVRIVSVISKAMLSLNTLSKMSSVIGEQNVLIEFFSVCDHLKDEETAARAYMEFIRTQELRQVRKQTIPQTPRVSFYLLGEKLHWILACSRILG